MKIQNCVREAQLFDVGVALRGGRGPRQLHGHGDCVSGLRMALRVSQGELKARDSYFYRGQAFFFASSGQVGAAGAGQAAGGCMWLL